MQILRVVKKFRLILSHHQKFRIFELLLLMIFGGFLETFSISLILPFMDVVTNPEKMMGKQYIKNFCNFFNIRSSTAFIVTLAVSLALLYIVKNIYLILQYHFQYRFVYGNMFTVQHKLLEILINRPYEYFLSINSGEVIRIINTDTSSTFALLVTLLFMCSEIVVSGMLIIAIFIMVPIATIAISFLLFLILLFINYFIKPIMRQEALKQQQASREMNKWLLQSIQGIKELKVLNAYKFFLDNYRQNGTLYVQSLRNNQTLTVVPRFLIEGISMGIMFIVLAVMIALGTKLEDVMPILTAITMAVMRLLPSVNRISASLAQIAFYEPMLDKTIENLRTLSYATPNIEKTNIDKNISVNKSVNILSLKKNFYLQNITFSYPDSDKKVIESASLNIMAGETIGIVGASGAGKTTLADIILGLLHPSEGQFFIDGKDVTSNMEVFHSQIGYIPQSIFMLDDTITANITFGQIPDYKKLNRVVKEAALKDFISELPEGLNTKIGERGVRLSGGQKQRIGIARALYREPDILILDEATSALDNETEEAIMQSINSLRGKKTMIIIAHRLSTIQNCDHVYRVQDGKIVRKR